MRSLDEPAGLQKLDGKMIEASFQCKSGGCIARLKMLEVLGMTATRKTLLC